MKKLFMIGIITVSFLVLGTVALACDRQIDVDLGIEGTNFGNFDLTLGVDPESINLAMGSSSSVIGYGSLYTTGGLAGSGSVSWDGGTEISGQMDFGNVQINAFIWNTTHMSVYVDP